METTKMTKYELQAKLEDAQRALEIAERAIAEMHETLGKVDHHPDAPAENSPAYALGSLRAQLWFANSAVCSALGHENTLKLVG